MTEGIKKGCTLERHPSWKGVCNKSTFLQLDATMQKQAALTSVWLFDEFFRDQLHYCTLKIYFSACILNALKLAKERLCNQSINHFLELSKNYILQLVFMTMYSE